MSETLMSENYWNCVEKPYRHFIRGQTRLRGENKPKFLLWLDDHGKGFKWVVMEYMVRLAVGVEAGKSFMKANRLGEIVTEAPEPPFEWADRMIALRAVEGL